MLKTVDERKKRLKEIDEVPGFVCQVCRFISPVFVVRFGRPWCRWKQERTFYEIMKRQVILMKQFRRYWLLKMVDERQKCVNNCGTVVGKRCCLV